MKSVEQYMRLYAVTDRAWLKGQTLVMQVEEALKGGVTCVQLREKTMDEKAFLAEALEIKEICKKYSVPFFINDNVDIAMQCGADGIHVGQKDMVAANVRSKIGESMMLGVSTQTLEQAVEAEKNGADYLGVGAVFATSTKSDADLLDHATLKAICEAVSIPVVAIGGIYKHNIMELTGTGVAGVALVSAIFASDDIEKECRELHAASERMCSGKPEGSR